MTEDAVGGAWVLEELWAPIVALTARDGPRAGGLIASTAVAAALAPELPRVVVQLSKANLTHDLALRSGAFAVHLLPAAPDPALRRSLELFRTLGLRSGRDGDKLAGVAFRTGRTGAPILEDALAWAEARIVGTLDGGGSTIVLADVVAGERRQGEALAIELALERMPPEWRAEWERSLARQQEAERAAR